MARHTHDEEEFENTDDLFKAMQADEFEGATKLAPIEYGRMRGISPQLVYYHIRAGHIKPERCLCGKKVIDVDSADQYFGKGDYSPEKLGVAEGIKDEDE